MRRSVRGLCLALVALVLSLWTVPAGVGALDSGGAEQTLFSLTNQDRASNGLGALAENGSLFSIARSQRGGCGGADNGRSQDMIERQYFSHQIPPCGQYVWSVFPFPSYSRAGENIGWNNYAPPDSVNQVNTAFMNSPEHRANILGDYTQAGMGAWAASGSWMGFPNVIMYTEIFIKSGGGGGGPPPPPPPPPPPRPTPRPTQPVPVPVTPPSPTVPTPVVPTPLPSPTVDPCAAPAPLTSAEADRNSPAPSLAPDGGTPPCPSPSTDANPASPSPEAPLTFSQGTAGATRDSFAVSIVDGALRALHLRTDAPARTSGGGGKEVGAERETARTGVLESVVDQVLRLFLNV